MIARLFFAILLVLAACATPAVAPELPAIAIVGATVVHPTRDVEPNATVLIRGDRIVAVGAHVAVPANAKVIDARGKFVIPGMIDTHVHFFQSANPFTRPDAFDLDAMTPYKDEVARNKARLPTTFKTWLACGVTTVADVGGPFWNFDVRDASTKMPAPRVFVAGPLLSMVSREKLDLGDPPIIKVTSPDEARALVARELPRKPDFIKLWFIHQPSDDLAKQEEIARAGADAAHAAGVRFAVHATELDVAKASLRAGANILVHSVSDAKVDAELIELAKKNKVIYTPTLFVPLGYALVGSGEWTPTEAERRLADPQILDALAKTKVPDGAVPERARARFARLDRNGPAKIDAENLRALWDAGIVIATGTDAGNIGTVHGPSIFREIEFMAKAGLTPKEILLATTTNGAKFVAMEKDLGEIAPGMLADLVVLDADPLADSANLSRAFRVFKGGEVFDPSEIARSMR